MPEYRLSANREKGVQSTTTRRSPNRRRSGYGAQAVRA